MIAYKFRHGDTLPIACPRCGAWMDLGTHVGPDHRHRYMPMCQACGITSPQRDDLAEAMAEARRLAWGRHAGLVARVERIVGWWWGQMRRCGG